MPEDRATALLLNGCGRESGGSLCEIVRALTGPEGIAEDALAGSRPPVEEVPDGKSDEPSPASRRQTAVGRAGSGLGLGVAPVSKQQAGLR